MSSSEKARVDFLSEVRIVLGFIQVFDDTVEKITPKPLFVVYVKCLVCTGCRNYLCAAFPRNGKEGILLTNQASPPRKSIFVCLSWDGNTMHVTSIREQEATHWLISHNMQENSMGKKARAAFLSIGAFGLMYFHWVEYMLHPRLFQSLVGDVCVKIILPWSYELARCCLSSRWKGVLAKSDLPYKENVLVFALQPSNLPAPNYCSESMRQHMCLWAILTGKSRWEIGKSCFPEHKGFGAAVPSWAWLTCWTRSFQTLGGCILWIGNFTLVVWTGYVLLVPDMEKKDFLCFLRDLQKGEYIWSAFWGTENPCHEPGLSEHEAAHWNFSGNCRRCLVREEASVVYWTSIGAGIR